MTAPNVALRECLMTLITYILVALHLLLCAWLLVKFAEKPDIDRLYLGVLAAFSFGYLDLPLLLPGYSGLFKFFGARQVGQRRMSRPTA